MSESYHIPENKQPRKRKQFPEPGYKFCTLCEKELSFDCFHKDKKGNPISRCIECTRTIDRARHPIRNPRKTPIKPSPTKEGHKVCNTCFQEKPFEDFKKTSIFKDGHAGRCKQCDHDKREARTPEEREKVNAEKQVYYQNHIEEIRERDRLRTKTERHRQIRNTREKEKRAKQAEIRRIEKENNPPPPITHKVCPKCDPPTLKPLNEFPPRKGSRDGHNSYCYECQRKAGRSEEAKEKKNAREKQKLLNPEYRIAKREAINKWRKENAEEIRERNREKYANDPEYARRVLTNTHTWFKANPLKRREYHYRRKARLKQVLAQVVSYERIIERDGMFCYICEQEILLDQKLDFDHEIPLFLGGEHSERNIHPTHACCNRRKGKKLISKMTPFQRRGPIAS